MAEGDGEGEGGAIPQIHHQLDIYTFAKLTRSLTRRSINALRNK